MSTEQLGPHCYRCDLPLYNCLCGQGRSQASGLFGGGGAGQLGGQLAGQQQAALMQSQMAIQNAPIGIQPRYTADAISHREMEAKDIVLEPKIERHKSPRAYLQAFTDKWLKGINLPGRSKVVEVDPRERYKMDLRYAIARIPSVDPFTMTNT